MPKYRIIVRETVGRVIEIQADSEEEAEDKAENIYNSYPTGVERYELEAEVMENTVCKYCNKVMDINAGCTATKLIIRKGSSSYGAARKKYDEVVPCHDCNVGFDQYHHPGCDWERCPSCGGQAISCGHVRDWVA